MKTYMKRGWLGAIILAVVFSICVLPSEAMPQGPVNPFTGKPSTVEPASEHKPTVSSQLNSLLAPVYYFSSRIQKEIHSSMAAFARDIQQNPFGKSLFIYLLFAFLYGIFHAVGPGHGKSVVVSYFLCRPGRWKHAVIMANVTSFVHVLSGASVVLVIYFVYSAVRMSSFNEATPLIAQISYGLMVVIGLYLFVFNTRLILSGSPTEHDHAEKPCSMKEMLTAAFIAGLIPCPGAAMILMFSILLGILAQGLVAMVCVAMGMGLTISLFALASIFTKRAVLLVTNRHPRAFLLSYACLALLGALTITGLGLIMFVGSL